MITRRRALTRPHSALKTFARLIGCRRASRHCRPQGDIPMKTGASRNKLSLAPFFVIGTLIVLTPLALRAGPFVTGALVQVSGPSPFATCTADHLPRPIPRHPSPHPPL